jgi:DNA polymerase-3 subunit gamma/tau
MLGLADRTKLLDLFKEVLLGDLKKATSHLRDLVENGLDAKNFLNDILEILYLFNRRINLGPIEKDTLISEGELSLIEKYSQNLDIQDLGIFWQLTIKTMDDLKIVANENLALEMYLMQLVHLKKIEDFTELKTQDEHLEEGGLKTQEVNKHNEVDTRTTTNQLKSTNQIKESVISAPKLNNNQVLQINNLQDLIYFAEKEKEVELKFDLERNVNLVSFEVGKIDISFNEKLNKNFIKNLTEKLLLWTEKRWIISLSKRGGEISIYEKNLEDKTNKLKKENKNKLAEKLFSAFDDAKLIDVKDNDA